MDNGVALDNTTIQNVIRQAVGGIVPLNVRIVEGIEGLTPADVTALTNAGVKPTNELDGFVSGNELVINRRNAQTETQVSLLAAHEILGHYGMRARYGTNLNKTLDEYYRRLGGTQGVIEAARQYGVSLPDQYGELVKRARSNSDRNAQRALTQELFAAASESEFLQPGSRIANGLSDFVSRVKGFMARFPAIGKLFDSFSERDIMRVVRDSANAARQTGAPLPPLETAASIGGAARRVLGVQSGDNVVFKPDGGTTVVKPDERGVTDDGTPVRIPNQVQAIESGVVAQATGAVKQSAQNTLRGVIGTAADQIKGSRDPLKRAPNAGTVRKKVREASALTTAITALADNREPLRRISKAVREFIGNSAVINDLAERINERLDTRLNALDSQSLQDSASTQGDLLNQTEGSIGSEAEAQAQRIIDVQNELAKSLNSGVESDISDAMDIHSKTVTAPSLGAERFRSQVIELDTVVDEAALAAVPLVPDAKSAEDILLTASAIAKAVTSLERNRLHYTRQSPVNSVGQAARQRVLDKIESIDREGKAISPTLGASLQSELQQIGVEYYTGPRQPGQSNQQAYDEFGLTFNTTGLSSAAANEILTDAGATETDFGVYTGVMDALAQVNRKTDSMRQSVLPQAYFNERAIYGLKHNFPIDSVDAEKYPMYANDYTTRSRTDFQSENDRKSQFTGNAAHDTRIQAQLAASNTVFNDEVTRSLLLNVLASEGSLEHQSLSKNAFDLRRFEVISKNDPRNVAYQSNTLDGKEAKDTFIYSVPNSDTAVLMQFDPLSKTPLQIRGERRGEEFRELSGFKAARHVTGGMSRLMTRNNANFLPRAHVREFLTAGFFLTAEQGLGAGVDYINRSIDNNAAMPDIYRYMRLRNTRTPEAERERKKMLESSPHARELQELIDEGGLITQLSGLSEPGQADITRRNTSTGLRRGYQHFDNYVGSISDTTDAIVRLSAYQAQRSQGKTKQEAAVYAKRLANFEARGKYSGPLGDLLMFYNPSAVGAARFTESLLEGEYARPALLASVGAGVTFSMLMAALVGNADEEESMDRQTTDLRIPTGNGLSVAIPAGFSVMSVGVLLGNQLGGFMRGKQDLSELTANTYEILTNNASPVPASSIPLVDAQGQFQPFRYVGDTFTPSAIKPITQFLANMNGLGLPIYRTGFANTAGGLTDAFNGRESDIGTWSDRLATAMHESTGGAIDVNPGTLRHFMSSYMNGINTVMDFGAEAYNLHDGVQAGNSFIDRSLGFGGFFSKTGHSDEYYQARQTVEAVSKQLKTYEATGRDQLAKQLRARLPADFDEQIKAINRNKRAQDKANSELRPTIYGALGTVGQRRQAVDLLTEQRRQLQAEGLALMAPIIGLVD